MWLTPSPAAARRALSPSNLDAKQPSLKSARIIVVWQRNESMVYDPGAASGAKKNHDFQASANEQGQKWHKDCIAALIRNGFEIVEEHLKLRDVGIELDAITQNDLGIAMAWEFKGSWEGERPGLTRTDTMKKAIANGCLLSVSDDYRYRYPPLLVMTTHEPEDGSALMMMSKALIEGWITYITHDRDNKFLKWLCEADEEMIRELIEQNHNKPMPDPTIQRGRRFPRRSRGKSMIRNTLVDVDSSHPMLFSVDNPHEGYISPR